MLRHIYKKKFKGVALRSGYFYKFKYQAWEHDPKPTVIFMSSIEGIHPNSGHQWRIFQCINFTYIPRAVRKRFLKIWLKELEKGAVTKLTWKRIIAKYPYLKLGIRRYFFKPNYYIRNLKEIPIDQVEKEVISTWSKDFSKKVKTALLGKFKKAMKQRFSFSKKQKKKKNKRGRK